MHHRDEGGGGGGGRQLEYAVRELEGYCSLHHTYILNGDICAAV